MIPTRLRIFTEMRARFGWKRATHATLLWVLRQVTQYREAAIFCLDLDRVAPHSNGPDFEWTYMDVDAVEPAVREAAGLDENTVTACIRSGDRCFGGLAGSSVCYVSMVSTSGFRVPGRVSVSFEGSEDAYVGNCFTLEPYRGRGIYPRALLALGSSLKSEGRRRLYLFVERENLPSIRSVEKAGFRPVAICRSWMWRGCAKRSYTLLDETTGLRLRS